MPCAHGHGCPTVGRRCGDDLSEVWRRRRPAALGGLAFLGAVSGALQSLLRWRGEMLGEFRVAVMVGGRETASPGGQGNRAVPPVVAVPAAREPEERLARLTGTFRVARPAATGPPLLAALEPLFRVAASAGL